MIVLSQAGAASAGGDAFNARRPRPASGPLPQRGKSRPEPMSAATGREERFKLAVRRQHDGGVCT